jgi:RNA polymerase primary sigma factor
MTSLDNNDPVRIYLREVGKVPPLEEGEEADLFQHIRNQDDPAELATKRLIEVNLHLVPPIADWHSSAGLSMLELIEEGNLGLMHAIKSFSGNDKTFVSYAVSCIEDAITKAIAESRSASQ